MGVGKVQCLVSDLRFFQNLSILSDKNSVCLSRRFSPVVLEITLNEYDE